MIRLPAVQGAAVGIGGHPARGGPASLVLPAVVPRGGKAPAEPEGFACPLGDRPPRQKAAQDRGRCPTRLPVSTKAAAFGALRQGGTRARVFGRAGSGLPRTQKMVPLVVPPIRQVAAAITTSPRLAAVLAEAGRFAQRLNAPWLLIHGGAA